MLRSRCCAEPEGGGYRGGRMKVTIVTPVCNGMPWLPESIESVARQRVDADVEHLVYDGGSTDGSVEWLRGHTSLGYEVLVGPDDGQTDALVKGFDRASGDIFAWLNADDLLEPGAVARVIEVFAADPGLSMVSGACLLVDARGSIVGAISSPPAATIEDLLCHPSNPAQPATFFTASAYRRCGGLDRRYDLAMDVDLWLKLAEIGPVRTLPDQVLARFRIHSQAKSVVAAGPAARQDLRIRRTHGMPLRSRAGVALVTAGYVRPVVSPWSRAFRGLARRIVLGPRGRHVDR